MKNAIILSIIGLMITGCVNNKDTVKYTDYGFVKSVKCETNNVCAIETSNSLAIVHADFLPASPSINERLYSATESTALNSNVMWCLNKNCKVTTTCKSITDKCS